MKNLYSLFLLLAGIFCFISCSGDDDYVYTAPASLDVTKVDLHFNSVGGTGSVEVRTDRGLTAESSVAWCTLNVSGGVVTATVTENLSIESRAGTITVSDGVLSTVASVYQQGLACSINIETLNTVSDNGENSTFITIESSSPYTITIPAYATSWLSYTDEGGKVTFNLQANGTGTPRAANVTIESGSKTTVIPIAQYEIGDLAGTWNAEYFNYDEEQASEPIEVTIPSDGVLNLAFGGVPSPFVCAYEDGLIKIANATPMGNYAGLFYLFSVMFSQDGYLSWATGYTYTGYPKVTGDGAFYIEFGDDGSWPDKVITGVGVQAFLSTPPGSSGNMGNLAIYDSLVLKKP